MWKCKHCSKEFDFDTTSQKANHSRWCDKNPKLESYKKHFVESTQAGITKDSFRKRNLSISNAHKRGVYKNSAMKSVETKRKNGTLNHSQESKDLIQEKALASKHRRLMKSTRIYTKKDGIEVLLDSSWEEILAIRLDSLDIEWDRPTEPIIWVDSLGRNRNYFPDFYLLESKLFIDPKNYVAMISQKEKVDWLLANRKDVQFLHSAKECREFMERHET